MEARIEAHHIETVKSQGWVGAPRSEVRRLVEAGMLRRISGEGKGLGNTPIWAPTPEAKAEWALGTGERSMVKTRSWGWLEVISEAEGKIVVWRKGGRVTIPAALVTERA